MKIWCEKCNGTGKEIISYGKPSIFEINHAYKFKCKECKGKGFNEIDLDLQEIGTNGRISLAIHTALQEGYQLQFYKGLSAFLEDIVGFDTIDELLKWSDEYYERM